MGRPQNRKGPLIQSGRSTTSFGSVLSRSSGRMLLGNARSSWRSPANRLLRAAINGVIFRLRSGCQWNKLPKHFGDDSSVHRWFQRWSRNGIFERVWAVLVEECGEFGAVHRRGKQQTVDWAKLDSAAKTWGKTPPTAARTAPSSRSWSSVTGTTRGSDRWSQRSRSETARGHDRGNRGRTPRPQEA